MLARMSVLISVCLLLAPPQALARSVTGKAEIVDGDTLTVSGMKRRSRALTGRPSSKLLASARRELWERSKPSSSSTCAVWGAIDHRSIN